MPAVPQPNPEDRSHETRILLLIGAVGVTLFLIVAGAVGTGVWLVVKQIETVRADRAEAERQRADEASRLAETAPAKPPQNVIPPVPPPASPPPVVLKPKPVTPPKPAAPVLPAFDEPKNPYKLGKQTVLREVRSVTLPELRLPPEPKTAPAGDSKRPLTYEKFIHSPKHQLLFAMSANTVWVYDLKTGQAVGTQEPKRCLTDMSLSPDQSALFVIDYGSRRYGYNEQPTHSHIHRFDLKTRKWEVRKAPKSADRIEAIDTCHVVVLAYGRQPEFALNLWEQDGIAVRELSQSRVSYTGDIEYDPRTGRLYHGSRGISSYTLTVQSVKGDNVTSDFGNEWKFSGRYGNDSVVTLSVDGTRLYYGGIQFNTTNLDKKLRIYPEQVLAASRDVVFGKQGNYYHAATGEKLGGFDFRTTTIDKKYRMLVLSAVVAVSPDGMSVWVLDRDKNVVRQLSLGDDDGP